MISTTAFMDMERKMSKEMILFELTIIREQLKALKAKLEEMKI
jgi:hypothetical protein